MNLRETNLLGKLFKTLLQIVGAMLIITKLFTEIQDWDKITAPPASLPVSLGTLSWQVQKFVPFPQTRKGKEIIPCPPGFYKQHMCNQQQQYKQTRRQKPGIQQFYDIQHGISVVKVTFPEHRLISFSTYNKNPLDLRLLQTGKRPDHTIPLKIMIKPDRKAK